MSVVANIPYAAPAKVARPKRKPRGVQAKWKLPTFKDGEHEVRCTYAAGALTFRVKHKRKVHVLTLKDAYVPSTGQSLLELEKK